jgi:hypothetical protein
MRLLLTWFTLLYSVVPLQVKAHLDILETELTVPPDTSSTGTWVVIFFLLSALFAFLGDREREGTLEPYLNVFWKKLHKNIIMMPVQQMNLIGTTPVDSFRQWIRSIIRRILG